MDQSLRQIMLARKTELDQELVDKLIRYIWIEVEENFSPNMPFHIYGSWLVEQGLPIKTIQQAYLDQLTFWMGLDGLKLEFVVDRTDPSSFRLLVHWNGTAPV